MNLLAAQLPLQLNPKEVYNLENFYFSQAELQKVLLDFDQVDCVSFLYLWGEASTGKSHILMAMAEKTANNTLYLPLSELVQSASPEVLESVEKLDLLCIDNLDAITDRSDWQEALFHCFNRLQHSGCKLLVTATHSPAAISLTLPDLRSRMATALIYQLVPLNDKEKQQALMMQAKARGLDLSQEVASYILRHHSRDMQILMAFLHDLDKTSMVEKRRLTIPLVRQVLHG